MTCEGAREHNNRNSLTVIKARPATLSELWSPHFGAINGRETKVYEIIDARLKGRQLCETQGGLRKGLLIRKAAVRNFRERLVLKFHKHVLWFLDMMVFLFLDATLTCVLVFYLPRNLGFGTVPNHLGFSEQPCKS